ncbi:MAG: monomeric [FeFe] hydrogenase [Christensenellaceae bacterium]
MAYEYKFDTTVQLLKYKVLKSLIRKRYHGSLDESIYRDIPKQISPGPKATMRCCVYKERAILQERIHIALGGDPEKQNVVQVIDIACDECPDGGIYVTESCRGCITHKCMDACPKKAISIIEKKSVVDKTKCIECGKCTQACPYGAIVIRRRPCMRACHVNAITMDENLKARINDEKCIACGACIAQCPFGAIQDRSFIMDAIDMILGSYNNYNYKVYAILAPSIASQIDYASMGQIVTALKIIGFYKVVEAAVGADICLHKETEEWKERGVMTTSCCPAFVSFIEKNYPTLAKYISSSLSPMVEAAKVIKSKDPGAKIIFIGPCSAKKMEFRLEKTGGAIDCVLSFEEMISYIDALEIDMPRLEETPLDDASYYGRLFAKSGGITEGISKLASEEGLAMKPVAMNGLEECRKELMLLKANRSTYNFFEGMACDGGCIGGALNLHRDVKGIRLLDKFNATATKKSVAESVALYAGIPEKKQETAAEDGSSAE